MKRVRFSEEQIIGVLREQEAGAKGADLCRKYGMSEATLYNWKAKYGGLDVSEAKRLKALEDENAKLKQLLADAMLDAAALKELLGKNGRPSAGSPSCCARGASASSARRQARGRRSAEGRLRDLAHQRHRFGYRRLHVLLRRDGEAASRNKVYRLYRAEGLAVRKRKSRRRAVGQRAPLLPALLANVRWSLDFVHDQLACGRRFRILNVVDDATRECLLAVADTSISGKRVVRELRARFCSRRLSSRMLLGLRALSRRDGA